MVLKPSNGGVALSPEYWPLGVLDDDTGPESVEIETLFSIFSNFPPPAKVGEIIIRIWNFELLVSCRIIAVGILFFFGYRAHLWVALCPATVFLVEAAQEKTWVIPLLNILTRTDIFT